MSVVVSTESRVLECWKVESRVVELPSQGVTGVRFKGPLLRFR